MVEIFIENSSHHCPPAVPVRHSTCELTFVFNLAGHMHCRLPGCDRLYEFGPDEGALLYSPQGCPCFQNLQPDKFHRVWICIERRHLCRYYQVGCPFLPQELRCALHEDGPEPFVFDHHLSPLMKTALHQIAGCPFETPHSALFQESKALELIACHLELMCTRPCQGASRCACCRLTPEDIRRIRAAREILINAFEAPPCLKMLAARVGLNVTKLKRGFRQVYGDSVFAYLRAYRMEMARGLLENGEMNVTEVAMAVGYTNIGHFGAVFKRHFGVNPGYFLRRTSASHLPNR